MARPQKIDRPVGKKINLPTSLVAQVDLHLFSELEGQVPFGAWSDLVCKLLREHLASLNHSSQPPEKDTP